MKDIIKGVGHWIKKHSFLSILLLVILAGGWSVYVMRNGNPFKVTDPDSPYFNPMKYDFRDYRGETQEVWLKATRKAFPQGASMERVEVIMAHNSCHYDEKTSQKKIVRFSCESPIRYPLGFAAVIFYFGDDGRMIDYFSTNIRGIYSGKFYTDLDTQQ